MIQRIQTLFLLAVLVLSGLMWTGDLIRLEAGQGAFFSIGFAGLSDPGGEVIQRLWPLSMVLAVIPALTATAILLYRKRQVQMRVTMMVLLLSLGTLILGAFYVIMFDRKMDVTLIWRAKAIFPLISAILTWLAYRNILRDDLKVRSYDRLR